MFIESKPQDLLLLPANTHLTRELYCLHLSFVYILTDNWTYSRFPSAYKNSHSLVEASQNPELLDENDVIKYPSASELDEVALIAHDTTISCMITFCWLVCV